MSKQLDIIGSTAYITIEGIENVPAKIDTGADSSAVWVSDVNVTKNNILEFKMFDKSSKYYTGKVCRRADFRIAVVRSSNGIAEIRYRTHLKLRLGNREIRGMFTLADRSKNRFPVLIGRRTLRHKFLVDVSKAPVENEIKHSRHEELIREFEFDPFTFHENYVKNDKPLTEGDDYENRI